MKSLCFRFFMQCPAYAVSAPSVQPQTIINAITPAKIRNRMTGDPWSLVGAGDAAGDGDDKACCALRGAGVDVFHCEGGMNEKPRSIKKCSRRKDTNAAPIAPEM